MAHVSIVSPLMLIDGPDNKISKIIFTSEVLNVFLYPVKSRDLIQNSEVTRDPAWAASIHVEKSWK